MHSERIDRQVHTKPTNRALTRRRLLLRGGSLLGGVALTACGDGTSREAARGREQDTSKDSVLKDLQATETWNLVNATPPAGSETPEGE